MKDYVFQNDEIQAEWIGFSHDAWTRLRSLKAKVPKDLNTRAKGIEAIIENLMYEQFGDQDTGLLGLAELNGRIEYFYDVANSEAMMSIYEVTPKMHMTLIKSQAEGKIASILSLVAFGKHVWGAVERALMSAQSLLKRCP